MPVCRNCETTVSDLQYHVETRLCVACKNDPSVPQINYGAPTDKEHRKWTEAASRQQTAPIVMVTTPTVPGRDIVEPLGIVSAQVAFGMNLIKDLFAGFRDIVGGRATSQQNVIADSREGPPLRN